MFKDRIDVGVRLSAALSEFKGRTDTVVVALPRGGVVPGRIIADTLGLPLEVVMVKKIGHPLNPECAIGAVRMNSQILDSNLNVDTDYVKSEISRLRTLLKERYRRYYGDVSYPDFTEKKVILVDDGIATGSTMFAAIELLKKERVHSIIVAVPVGPNDTVRELAEVVDKVVCLETYSPFYAIGEYYENFDQVSDDEVLELLRGR